MTAALCVFFVAAIVGSVWRLPPLHPLQLWTASLGLAVVAHSLHLLPYRTLQAATILFLAGATAAFAVGVFAARGGRRYSLRLTWAPSVKELKIAATVALGVTVVMLVAFLMQVASNYSLRQALIISPDVRVGIYTGETFVTIKYLYVAFAAVALCAMVAGRSGTARGRWGWLGLALAGISTTYFSTGRGNVLTGIVIAIVAFALTRPQAISRRRLVLGAATGLVLAVALIYGLGQVIGKTFEEFDISTVDSTFVEHSALQPLAMPYHSVAAPVGALDRQVEVSTTWGRAKGCASLALACRGLARVGVPLEAEPGIRPFTGEPMPWNTYTALDGPLIDGGLVLAIPIVGLLGLLTGAVWELARRRASVGVLLYALWAPAAVWAGTINHFLAPHLLGAIVSALACLAVAHWVVASRRRAASS
jgi:hypothetical protein